MTDYQIIRSACMIIITLCIVILTFLAYISVRETAFHAYGKAFTLGTVFNYDNNTCLSPESLKQ